MSLKRLLNMRSAASADALDSQADASLIARRAGVYRNVLKDTKARNQEGLVWYPYDSLSNFPNLDGILTGDQRSFLKFANGYPVLDIGCGDGDCAFFLESLGLSVVAIDNPATNHNGMQGVRRLKEILGSSVVIQACDLDAHAGLPPIRCGLALFCGTLYHLKNPFYALEALSEVADYCALSTRVARWSPDHRTALDHLPVGYLLDEFEANGDDSNFWIFTNAALKRLIRRSGWEILDYGTIGDQVTSDPASNAYDERAFCFLRSKHKPTAKVELLNGCHVVERGSFRWTERRFSVLLGARTGVTPSRLRFNFSLPEILLADAHSIYLRASVNGVALPPVPYCFPGDNLYVQPLPEGCVQEGEDVVVEFEVDRSVTGVGGDERELALQVVDSPGSPFVTLD